MSKKHPSPLIYVGVDVSQDKLDVAWRDLEGTLHEFQVPNDKTGHEAIVSQVTADAEAHVQVVLEATGPYSGPLATFLSTASPKLKFMLLQPRAARDFAKATMRRAKTDRVDARVLCEFSQRMDFVPTTLPESAVVALRSLARHLGELVDRRAALKNQRHALKASGEIIPALTRALDAEEKALTDIIDELEQQIVVLLDARPDAKRMRERMESLPGIKTRTVVRVLPELLAMPKSLTPREAVAFAGLDPRPQQSGTSRNATSWPISKQGNARIRRSLYLTSLSAIRYFAPMKAVYERLRGRGKPKKVAIVATMRKMLTALWSMWTKDEAFNEAKFTPAAPASS